MSTLDPRHDRAAVVSGAGTGIGRAIAVKFGELGWRVAIGGRRTEPLRETAALVEQAGGTCFAHPLDVTDPASVERFFEAAEKELGPVTVIINNAAAARIGPLEDLAPEEINSVISTKLIGALYLTRQGILSMRRGGVGGDVLFITSTSAVQPWPYYLAYGAASAGAEQAARALRLELEGSGIRINLLRCGNTKDTEFATRELGSAAMMAANEMWFRRGLLRHAGLMSPDAVAEAVAASVTLPMGYQYDVLALDAAAPAEEPPATYEEFIQGMIRHHLPDLTAKPDKPS